MEGFLILADNQVTAGLVAEINQLLQEELMSNISGYILGGVNHCECSIFALKQFTFGLIVHFSPPKIFFDVMQFL